MITQILKSVKRFLLGVLLILTVPTFLQAKYGSHLVWKARALSHW